VSLTAAPRRFPDPVASPIAIVIEPVADDSVAGTGATLDPSAA